MDKSRLTGIVKNFSGKKIAVVGDIVVDSYIFGISGRLNPESAAPLLTVYDDREKFSLGCAGNVAMNLVSLGADVYLFGAIGNDANGQTIKDLCASNKIKLGEVAEGSTIKKQRFFESTHNYYMFRIDFGETNLKPLTEESGARLLEQIAKSRYDAIILSDYNKRVLRGGLAQKVIGWAYQRNIMTVADPKPDNINYFYGVTVIRPNEKEARAITGVENGDIKEVARRLKERAGAKYSVITRGKDGMIVYDEDFHEIKTSARKVSDVSGAGDTVAAAIALCLTSEANIREAANIANYAAGIVVEKPGTATTTQKEILDRILIGE